MLEETEITAEMVEEYDRISEKPENMSVLEASSKNPIWFARYMLGIELYTWQKIVALDIMRAVEDSEYPREFVVLTSRQIGKSWLSAIIAIWIGMFNKIPSGEGQHSPCGVISATDQQSRELLRVMRRLMRMGDLYCRKHYSKRPGDIMDTGVFSEMIDKADNNNQQTLTFKAAELGFDKNTNSYKSKYGDFLLKDSKIGSTINSFPPTPIILGRTFSYLHEDEAGRTEYFPDEAHFEFIRPTGDAYNAIRIYTSTPWVPSGFFYELADPDDTKTEHQYHRYLFTIEAIKYDNPIQYLTVLKNIAEMRRDGKKDEVERAYYCRFVKGEQSYFTPKTVDKMFNEDLKMVESYGGECDIGVDFGGQVKSKTVVTVSALIDGKIRRLYHRVYDVNKDESLIYDLEFDIMKRFPRWQRIIPDECAAAAFRIAQMQNKGWNVQPMSFRTWKVKKFGAFRSMLNNGKIESYPDEHLKIEMKALEFANNPTNSTIVAARGYSDDLIDSFVMSSFFFLEERTKMKFFTWKGQYKVTTDG